MTLAPNLRPHQLTQPLVSALFARWREHYSHNTLYHYRQCLRSLLKHLEAFGAPHLETPKVKGPTPRPNIATPDQVAALLRAAAPWLRLFILLCWQTALRFSEAWAVTPRSYDAKTNTISITTKGGKHRVIPVPPDVETLLKPTLEGHPDTSCIALLKGGRCSKDAIRDAWLALAKSLGIAGLTPHDLRRTTATALYRATHDIRAVQQYLGHDHLTSTVHYLAPLQEEELRGLHRLLHFHSEVKQ